MTFEIDLALVERAMAGDTTTRAMLVDAMAPVVRVRVARALGRRARARGRSPSSDVEDLAQDTFAMLFRDHGRALRAWDPERGLTFLGFVGLLAERAVGMALRTHKRDPWLEEPTDEESLVTLGTPLATAARLEARDELREVLLRAKARLSGAGWNYLQWLVLEERPVDEIARHANTTPDAIYTWRTRIKRVLQDIRCELADEGTPNWRAGLAR